MCHNLRDGGRGPVAALTAGTKARYRLRIAISAYSTCIRRPRRVVPVGVLLSRLAWKTRMVALPDGEKILRIRLLVSTQLTNVTDRHTQADRHRMTA